MKVIELIKILEKLNPESSVIIEAVNQRQSSAFETPSEFLDIDSARPAFALTSREASTEPVRFEFVTDSTEGAREVVFIQATNQF